MHYGSCWKLIEALEYEIDDSLSTQYTKLQNEIIKKTQQDNNDGVIHSIVSVLANKILPIIDQNNNLKEQLLDCMQEIRIEDRDNILETFLPFISLINEAYVQVYHRIPSIEEYVGLLSSISQNSKMQEYYSNGFNLEVFDNTLTSASNVNLIQEENIEQNNFQNIKLIEFSDIADNNLLGNDHIQVSLAAVEVKEID